MHQIIDRGRGPEIAGTRITVYDIMDYYTQNWHHTAIAATLRLSSAQVLTAIEYIETHKEEVTVNYQKILERCARGNPPELQAKLDETHAKYQKIWAERFRQARVKENGDEGNSGGHELSASAGHSDAPLANPNVEGNLGQPGPTRSDV